MLGGLLGLCTAAQAATTGGIPRYPDLHGQTVVFTAGSDLWTVPVAGGTARQLSSHEGVERFARFSPDGKKVAYTADYDGDSNVWIVPVEGGEPSRLTWHTQGFGDDTTWDWSPDGSEVLFSSRFRSPHSRYAELFAVSIEGGLPRTLPTSDIGPVKQSPEGDLVFNRVFRNFRTWKRYRGGSQQDLWRLTPEGQSEQLTDFPGTDTHPMVSAEGEIYFVSDRPADAEGNFSRRNLFRYVPGGEPEQLTRHEEFDVDWPSLDQGRIIYMHGTDLRLLDLSTGEDRALDLHIPDEAHSARGRHMDVSPAWSALSVGPQARRVAVVARGDLFTVPATEGAARRVHSGSDRVDLVAWSPDGKQLAYVSDASGDKQLWRVDQDGRGEPRQLTEDNRTWIHQLDWSPDGSRLLYTDKRMRLWDVDASTGARTLVDTGKHGRIVEASYSRDGSWMSYVKPDANGLGAIWLHRVADGRSVRLTDDFNADGAPAFDPEGRYLYFSSARNYDLIGDTFEWRYVHRRTDYLYVMRLAADGPDPLEPPSDEEVDASGSLAMEEDEEDEREKKRKKRMKRKKRNKVVVDAPTLEVDLEGLAERVQRLPVEAGRYSSLQATEAGLWYLAAPPVPGAGESSLMFYDLEEQEAKEGRSEVVGFELAASGDKLLLASADGKLGTAEAKPGTPGYEELHIRGLRSWIEPREEWARALDEVRRYMREFFYDPQMHGKDWDAIHDRYAAVLERATHVSDVRYLIGELIGELNAGHAYSWGTGGAVSAERAGYLGADLESVDGGIRITRILQGEPGDPRRSSPLRAPGVQVEEGDFLVAIDGRELGPADNPYQWLVGTIGQPVRLRVNDRPALEGSREVTVYPVRSESQLRYWDWVEERRQRVLEASDGRVGYVHLPNTAVAGYTEFVRGLHAQSRLDGLVIDVRYNRGGFIPEMFIEYLLRPLYNIWVPRDGAVWRTPDVAFHGPMACITNGYAGSGGDAFPYYFKQFELGPTVGTRTWGGLVGIDNSLSLLIGGGVTAPSFAFVNREGEWDVERIGVAPDVRVVEPPEAARLGQDPQLDAAIDEVLQALESWEDPVPEPPESYPVRP